MNLPTRRTRETKTEAMVKITSQVIDMELDDEEWAKEKGIDKLPQKTVKPKDISQYFGHLRNLNLNDTLDYLAVEDIIFCNYQR